MTRKKPKTKPEEAESELEVAEPEAADAEVQAQEDRVAEAEAEDQPETEAETEITEEIKNLAYHRLYDPEETEPATVAEDLIEVLPLGESILVRGSWLIDPRDVLIIADQENGTVLLETSKGNFILTQEEAQPFKDAFAEDLIIDTP